jgi:hypothetical protein
MRYLIPIAVIFLGLKGICLGWTTDTTKSLKKQPGWGLVTAGYRCPLSNRQVINSGHGFYVEAGLNLGRLVSKNTVIGLYAGWAFMDGGWSTSFNRSFVQDYKAAINTEQNLSAEQAKIVNASADLFASRQGTSLTPPGCEMRSFHNYSLYYGLMVKPPASWAPALKLYAGSTRSHFQGPGGIVSEGDYNMFQLRRSFLGMELIAYATHRKLPRWLNRIGVGMFYEHGFLGKGSVYFNDGNRQENISLARYTSEAFRKKYAKEQILGIRLSFWLI